VHSGDQNLLNLAYTILHNITEILILNLMFKQNIRLVKSNIKIALTPFSNPNQDKLDF